MCDTAADLLVFILVLTAVLFKHLLPFSTLGSTLFSVRLVCGTHIVRHHKLLVGVEAKLLLQLCNVVIFQRRAMRAGLALIHRAETNRRPHTHKCRLGLLVPRLDDSVVQSLQITVTIVHDKDVPSV